MLDSAQKPRDRRKRREGMEDRGLSRLPDASFADSLKKIVRRILRTQSCRTNFEARVLDEARRLLAGCELARDALERQVVDRLLGERREGRLEFAGQGAGSLCPPTQLMVANSTFARRAEAA
jgi:hypothetical protein